RAVVFPQRLLWPRLRLAAPRSRSHRGAPLVPSGLSYVVAYRLAAPVVRRRKAIRTMGIRMIARSLKFFAATAVAGALSSSGAVAQDGVLPQEGHIAGTVVGESGPEAGVWVIAETDDLPTKYVKIV